MEDPVEPDGRREDEENDDDEHEEYDSVDEEIEDDIPDETDQIVHKEYQSGDTLTAQPSHIAEDDQDDDEYSEDFEDLTHDETMLSPSQTPLLKKSPSRSPKERRCLTPAKEKSHHKKHDPKASSSSSPMAKERSKREQMRPSESTPTDACMPFQSYVSPPPFSSHRFGLFSDSMCSCGVLISDECVEFDDATTVDDDDDVMHDAKT
jgi:hypothetical protein